MVNILLLKELNKMIKAPMHSPQVRSAFVATKRLRKYLLEAKCLNPQSPAKHR